MNSRHLILPALLIFNGLISYGQFDSPLNPKQTPVDPDLVVQVGAFRNESYSSALKEKLSDVLDKTVILVTEDGFYKVRITGFTSQEEMEKFYSTLAFLGLKDFWVLPVKKQEEIKPQALVQPDTSVKQESKDTTAQFIGEEIPAASRSSIVLQIDVFHDKSEALKAKKKIETKLNLPVEIVQEWDYYKVFVTGFKTTDEANKYFSVISKLGYPNISLIENYHAR